MPLTLTQAPQAMISVAAMRQAAAIPLPKTHLNRPHVSHPKMYRRRLSPLQSNRAYTRAKNTNSAAKSTVLFTSVFYELFQPSLLTVMIDFHSFNQI